jgi:glycosyltransferase involved in cell wall biosynthesis
MAADRLALCIPARNAAGHLPRLLDSVRAQTVPFDEVLLYDDASSDGTGDIARAFGARVVRTEVNTGPSPGKNELARHTTAEWVHFHDADEVLAPEFVAYAHEAMSRPIDVLLFDTEDREDGTGEFLGRRHWDDAALRDDAVRYCIEHTVTNCGAYRREAFLRAGGFDTDEATKYNEDQAMHLRLALHGLRFGAAGYVGVIVYRRTGSMSSGHPIECARAQFQVLANTARVTGRRYSQAIGRRLWSLAGALGGYDDWEYVERCLRLAADLGYSDPTAEHAAIRVLARVSPIGAVRIREKLIRTLKPALRRGMPKAS